MEGVYKAPRNGCNLTDWFEIFNNGVPSAYETRMSLAVGNAIPNPPLIANFSRSTNNTFPKRERFPNRASLPLVKVLPSNVEVVIVFATNGARSSNESNRSKKAFSNPGVNLLRLTPLFEYSPRYRRNLEVFAIR